MKFKFHHILAFLSLAALVESRAASSPEDYWNSELPNSPMPQAVKDLLNPTSTPEWLEADKSTTVEVNKGGVNVNTGRSKPGGTSVNVGHGGVGVNTGKHGHGGPTVTVGGRHGPDPFIYNYAATETQLHDNPNIALFFLEKDMHPGKEMNLKFTKTVNGVKFLPRHVADSIPFSSNKLPQILDKFSFSPKSQKAETIKKTIQECEETAGVKGEEKFCATSLESMIDFATGKLGTNVKAISTNAENEILNPYKISKIKKMASEKSVVVCHKKEYAYAVFYCHKTAATVAYEVSMAAADGMKADAVAVCHRDTAAWNPKHLAFQVLKVKPGSVPICHFLPDDHIVWVPKY